MKKIAINGFGRIGRLFCRLALRHTNLQIAAINDLAPPATLAHLFKYDSSYGCYPGAISHGAHYITVDGHPILTYCEADPVDLPWKSLGIDVVLEATGRFLTKERAEKHRLAGAQHVVLSAPATEQEIPTVVFGINTSVLQQAPPIVSNASCTTNCLAPMVKVLDDHFGIEQGLVTTIHAYTADQSLQDRPHKDLRRARAANVSMIPTTTGAARAMGQIFPHLEGKLDGMAMRVPIINGSVVDFTCTLSKKANQKEVNQAMAEAAQSTLKGILAYTEEPIVSVDVINNPHSAIFDAKLTHVQDSMVKVIGWYDNEGGYAHRLIDVIQHI